jgi:hypothetical protein
MEQLKFQMNVKMTMEFNLQVCSNINFKEMKFTNTINSEESEEETYFTNKTTKEESEEETYFTNKTTKEESDDEEETYFTNKTTKEESEETYFKTNGKANRQDFYVKSHTTKSTKTSSKTSAKKSSKTSAKNKKFGSKLIKTIKTIKPNKEKDDVTISPQQIKAAREILEAFKQRRWTILTAQMQSGKTTTYYLVAAIMFMSHMVDKVIIFSGNNEIELKLQINDTKKKFIRHLINNPDIVNNLNTNECDNVNQLFQDLEYNLLILWGGTEMKKYEGHLDTDRVLYIWDESHYAQNKSMAPENFLTSVGINASGNEDELEELDNYILSVSATPFSEISDNKHQNQNKAIVNLNVDEKYHGVEKMLRDNLIHNYDYSQWNTHLSETLRRHKLNAPKYALLRLRDSSHINIEEAIQIIRRTGWTYKTFDSSKNTQIENIQELEDEPDRHTVIIMKGKCRMGKVVPKVHIAFCMETSKNPKTDVVLQGLLGRMCGYHPYGNVEIHLTNNVLSTEFDRYIQYIRTGEIIPRKANNILSGNEMTVSTYYPIIPIKVRLSEHSSNIRNDIQALFNEIKYDNNCVCVYESTIVENYNNQQQKTELVRRLANMNLSKMKIKYVNDANITYTDVAEKINTSLETKKPMNLGSSHGIKANDDETIVIWVFERAYPEFDIQVGDLFIDAKTKITSPEYIRETEETKKIPRTTKKEIFYDSDIDSVSDSDSDEDSDSDSDSDN